MGKEASELSKALTGAVNDRKISRKTMDNILKEYELLVDQDRDKAREYVLGIMNAIDMGADSSHLDVVRKQVVGSKEKRSGTSETLKGENGLNGK